MDRRVTIQSFSTAANDRGEPIKTWSTVTTVWAMVEWKRANEDVESGKETVVNNVIFTIRYRTMDETMRIVFDSENYDIKSIEEMTDRGRKRYLRIVTERAE